MGSRWGGKILPTLILSGGNFLFVNQMKMTTGEDINIEQ